MISLQNAGLPITGECRRNRIAIPLNVSTFVQLQMCLLSHSSINFLFNWLYYITNSPIILRELFTFLTLSERALLKQTKNSYSFHRNTEYSALNRIGWLTSAKLIATDLFESRQLYTMYIYLYNLSTPAICFLRCSLKAQTANPFLYFKDRYYGAQQLIITVGKVLKQQNDLM